MKTVVFAYHAMGLTGLEALKRAGFDIAAIFSHQDDPEENCWFGSVPDWAVENHIPLFCPHDVNTAEWISRIASLRPEVIFSFYYRHLLSPDLLAIPPAGAFNLHGSLLPRYRGRCPVNWVLVHGERETGVTIHRMVEKADAGDIIGQRVVPIAFEDTARSLYGKLCQAASVLLDETLPLIKQRNAPVCRQDLTGGSYYGGRTPADGRIDWHWSAERIYNLIRAVTEPYPGAFALTRSGAKLLIWWALPEESDALTQPGEVGEDEKGVFVQTGAGRLRLIDCEVEGKRMKNDVIGEYFKKREREVLL